jgi:hypothetical protein
MAVRDHRPVYRTHRIDVEIPALAIEARGAGAEQVFVFHARNVTPACCHVSDRSLSGRREGSVPLILRQAQDEVFI